MEPKIAVSLPLSFVTGYQFVGQKVEGQRAD